MIVPLKDIITKTLAHDASTRWQLSIIVNWSSIVGTLAPHVRLEKIQGTTAILGVFSASWMQELYFLSHVLIENINKHVQHEHITRIRFKQITRSHAYTKPQVRKHTPIPVPVTLTLREEEAIKRVSDIDIQQALRIILQRCHATNKKS